MSDDMKILTCDIETRPHEGVFWGLFNQNMGLNQVKNWGGTLMVGYKWHHQKNAQVLSDVKNGHDEMINKTHELFNEADVVVTYNGNSFDIKNLNREFALLGLNPPSSYESIDLMRAVKKAFRFGSNKLAHVTEQFGLSGKMSNSGMQMWMDILYGDADAQKKAWAEMTKYCRQDVKTTEELYDRIKPWITPHPNVNLYSGKPEGCTYCGSTALTWQGSRKTRTGSYPRYQCQNCGAWGSVKNSTLQTKNR